LHPEICTGGLECLQYSEDNKNYFCLDPNRNSAKAYPEASPPPCAKKDQVPCTEFTTAFGDIQTSAADFIKSGFGLILAASGAVALLLIMRAGYKIMTSQGKPETVQEGRDQLIAAIVGLLFLILAFVFLELIGVDILKIPDFKGSPQVNGVNHCQNSCQAENACSARGGKSLGTLDCSAGTICCE
jgi:hypothetical protein